MDPTDRSASRSSLDSHEGATTEGSLLDRFRKVASSIVRGSVKGEPPFKRHLAAKLTTEIKN